MIYGYQVLQRVVISLDHPPPFAKVMVFAWFKICEKRRFI